MVIGMSVSGTEAPGVRRARIPHSTVAQHAPHHAMSDGAEVARFYDRASDLMRELLCELAREPDIARPFAEIEDALGWPRRRVAAVLGGAGRRRQIEFAGRRPYRFQETRQSVSGRWEMWMDAAQARALRAARREESAMSARGEG
jgi:hypothetical protein